MLHALLSIVHVKVTIEGMKELGELVAQLRTQRGIETKKALAEALGKDAAWVSRLEGGSLKETPDPALMQRMSDVLGASQGELLRAAGYQIDDTDVETITVDRDDPRARVLLAVMPLSDDQAESWANSIEAWHKGKRQG